MFTSGRGPTLKALQGKMQISSTVVLVLCFAGSAAAFSVLPNQNYAARFAHKSVTPLSFAQKDGVYSRAASSRAPALRAGADDDDRKGGPLGFDSDLTPKESVDPALFVIFGILGKIKYQLISCS